MRSIILSSLACLALLYFSTLSHKRHDFREKKMLLNIKRVFWFSLQLLSETFLILRRIQRDIIINVQRSSWEVLVIFVIFSWHLNFFRQIFGKFSNIKFQENPSSTSRIVPCGRTYTMTLIAASCNSENAPTNSSNKLHSNPHYTSFPRNAPLPYFFRHFRDNLTKWSQRAAIIRLWGTFPNVSLITDKSWRTNVLLKCVR